MKIKLGLGFSHGHIPNTPNAFSPSSLSGLAYWQDPSDTSTITQSAGAVSAIADKSGNTSGATQGTGASQPITGTRTINGRNVLDFDGTNDYLILPSALYSIPAANSTVFVVNARDTNGADLRIIYGRDAGGGRYGIAANVGTLITVASGTAQPQRAITYDNNGHIMGMRRKANSLLPLFDGLLEPLDGGLDVTLTGLDIGQYPTGISRFNGTIGEVIIYNRALSIDEINQVGAYLSTKWGMTYTPFSTLDTLLPVDTSYVSFGDSIAAGSGATAAQYNWMNRLSTSINSAVLNKGSGGTVLQNSNDSSGFPRAGNGRDRYSTDVLGTNKRDMLVMMYGFNDMRYTDAPATMNAVNFENDMREVIDGLLSGGYDADHIVMCSLPYIDDTRYLIGSAGFTGSNAYIHKSYNDACRRIAIDYDLFFADLYNYMLDNGGTALLNPADVHPNDDGHAAIYEAILAAQKGSSLAFQPTNLTGLSLMIDASDTSTITESGGSVSQVDDLSGTYNNITQGTGANQASTGAATINSLNTLSFSSAGIVNYALANPIDYTNGYTSFIVSLPQDNATNKHYFGGSSSSFSHRLEATEKPQIVSTGAAVRLTGTNALSLVNPSILVAHTHPATGSALYTSGAANGSNTSTTIYANPITTIGASSTSFYGDIGEMLIYERVLTTTEINQVGNYLADKWGITWTDV